MSTSAADALARVDLFAGMGKKALEKVALRMKTVHHEQGKEIAVEGQSGIAFHLVQSGSADVLIGGRVVRALVEGDYFGELSLIDGKPRSATVRVTSDMITHTLVAWDFSPLLDEPEVAKALLLATCARLRAAEAR